MQELSFDQLLEATRTLPSEQRRILAQMLEMATAVPEDEDSFADVEMLNEVLSEAGAYSVFTPLADVHPHETVITDADLLAASQCISCEWEEEPL